MLEVVEERSEGRSSRLKLFEMECARIGRIDMISQSRMTVIARALYHPGRESILYSSSGRVSGQRLERLGVNDDRR
jgi:hypothetical protein